MLLTLGIVAIVCLIPVLALCWWGTNRLFAPLSHLMDPESCDDDFEPT